MNRLAVCKQISEEVGGPGFGELVGSVQMQLNRPSYLTFYFHDQRHPCGGIHGISRGADGGNIDIAVFIGNTFYLGPK